MANYTIIWTSASGSEARNHEVEASSEEEARSKFQEYLKVHYEDEYKDEGVKIVSVTTK